LNIKLKPAGSKAILGQTDYR